MAKVEGKETWKEKAKGFRRRMLKAKVARVATDVGDENGKGKKAVDIILDSGANVNPSPRSFVSVGHGSWTERSGSPLHVHDSSLWERCDEGWSQMFEHHCWHLGIWWRRGGPFRWQSSAVAEKKQGHWWLMVDLREVHCLQWVVLTWFYKMMTPESSSGIAAWSTLKYWKCAGASDSEARLIVHWNDAAIFCRKLWSWWFNCSKCFEMYIDSQCTHIAASAGKAQPGWNKISPDLFAITTTPQNCIDSTLCPSRDLTWFRTTLVE